MRTHYVLATGNISMKKYIETPAIIRHTCKLEGTVHKKTFRGRIAKVQMPQGGSRLDQLQEQQGNQQKGVREREK